MNAPRNRFITFAMRPWGSRRFPGFPATIAFAVLMLAALPASARAEVVGANLQNVANGVLMLMGYSLTPDVTTGALSFSNAETGNPGFSMSSLGAGFTTSRGFPLYLEGTAAYSRYDPTFIVSDGTEERPIPTKWNSFSVTVGMGWDFPITEELYLRPIANLSLGRVSSDLKIAKQLIENLAGQDIDFLDNGSLDAYGVGGSLMLDWERYRPENEIDLELRYTYIPLRSSGDTPDVLEGHADTQNASLWSRWRAPTGLTALDRPIRYVLEFSHTQFIGELRGAMGFDWLTSLGAGFELDSSKYPVIITRTRLLGRYKFGNNVQGWSIGLACSF